MRHVFPITLTQSYWWILSAGMDLHLAFLAENAKALAASVMHRRCGCRPLYAISRRDRSGGSASGRRLWLSGGPAGAGAGAGHRLRPVRSNLSVCPLDRANRRRASALRTAIRKSPVHEGRGQGFMIVLRHGDYSSSGRVPPDYEKEAPPRVQRGFPACLGSKRRSLGNHIA